MPASPQRATPGKNGIIALIAIVLIAGASYSVFREIRQRGAAPAAATAEDALGKATDGAVREPSNPAAMRAFGEALLQNQRQDDALKAMRRSIALDPMQADSHAGLGSVLEAMGQFDQAAQEYLRAIILQRDNVPALLGAGRISLKNGLDYAEPAFRRATAAAPDNADAWIGLGQADVRSQQVTLRAEAITAFDRAIALKTTRTDYRDDYAQALVNDDQFDKAESLLRDSLRTNDGDPAPHFLLGHLLQMSDPTRDRLAEAEVQIRLSLNLAPHNGSAERELGNIQLQEGRIPDAVATLEAHTLDYPSDLAAFRILSKAYGRSGRFDMAAKAAAHAASLVVLNRKVSKLAGERATRFLEPAYHQELIALYTQTGQTREQGNERQILERLQHNGKQIADIYNAYHAIVKEAFPEVEAGPAG